MNLVLITGLVVVGVCANSLGVLAEGGDYLADAAAIGVSILAIRLAGRPPTASRPQGYPMATTWAAGVNAGWLLVVSILILAGSLQRLLAGPTPVNGLPVLIVSAVAGGVMLVGALILRGDNARSDDADGNDDVIDDGDLNVRAVLLDTAADAAAAGGVAVAGAIILASRGLFWLDPAIAGAISLVVGYHAVRLLRRVVDALRNHALAS